MARRYIPSEPASRLAIWARRLALFALVASLLAIGFVRWSPFEEIRPALATFAGALTIAVVALLLAFAANAGRVRRVMNDIEDATRTQSRERGPPAPPAFGKKKTPLLKKDRSK